MDSGRKKVYVQFENEEDITGCHINSDIMIGIKFHSPGKLVQDKGKMKKLNNSIMQL